MTATKRTTKERGESRLGDITEPFEHIFLAGLGALSNAQEMGTKTFNSLVEQGEEFRASTSERTESMITDVQDTIRNIAGDSRSRATGLLDQVRDISSLDKLQAVFDKRVADAMDRLNVPSKKDIDAINKKLNKIIRLLEAKPARKKATKRSKKPAAKKAAR